MKTYTKTHKEKVAFDNHLSALKKRGAIAETNGMTIKYWFGDEYHQKHNEIVSRISKIEGVADVKDVFENPNKYGDIVSHIAFKHHIKDRWNYSLSEIGIDYKKNQVFVCNQGYFILQGLRVNDILSLVEKKFKLKQKTK
jgi:hypothetical protein